MVGTRQPAKGIERREKKREINVNANLKKWYTLKETKRERERDR